MLDDTFCSESMISKYCNIVYSINSMNKFCTLKFSLRWKLPETLSCGMDRVFSLSKHLVYYSFRLEFMSQPGTTLTSSLPQDSAFRFSLLQTAAFTLVHSPSISWYFVAHRSLLMPGFAVNGAFPFAWGLLLLLQTAMSLVPDYATFLVEVVHSPVFLCFCCILQCRWCLIPHLEF